MEDVIIDPYTGLELKSKIVNILPMRMNHDKKHTAARLRDQVIENSSNRTGPDGVIQLFPDKAGGSGFYLPDDNSNLLTDNKYYRFQERLSYTYNSIQESYARVEHLELYPAGNMGENKTRLSWNSKPKPENLGVEKGLRNHEITAYIKFGKTIGEHQTLLFRLQGRDEPVIRSAIEIGYPTASYGDVIVNVNYSVLRDIVSVKNVQQYLSGDRLTTPDKWYGIKVVYIVAEDNSWVWLGMYVDLNPINDYLKPRNNFRLKAECVFAGVKEFDYIIPSWRGFVDSIIVEGYEDVEFKYISDREIDVQGFKPLHSVTNPQTFKIASIPDWNPNDYKFVDEIEKAKEYEGWV